MQSYMWDFLLDALYGDRNDQESHIEWSSCNMNKFIHLSVHSFSTPALPCLGLQRGAGVYLSCHLERGGAIHGQGASALHRNKWDKHPSMLMNKSCRENNNLVARENMQQVSWSICTKYSSLTIYVYRMWDGEIFSSCFSMKGSIHVRFRAAGMFFLKFAICYQR